MAGPQDGRTRSPLRAYAWPAVVALGAIVAASAGVWLIAVPLALAAVARASDLLRGRL